MHLADLNQVACNLLDPLSVSSPEDVQLYLERLVAADGPEEAGDGSGRRDKVVVKRGYTTGKTAEDLISRTIASTEGQQW